MRPNRIVWIDVARGAAIILIVMHHARDYPLTLVPPSPEILFRWAYIDPLLRYIRLPLFFLLSGIVASGTLSRGDGGYKTSRAFSLLPVYAGWSVMLALVVPNWPEDSWVWALDANRMFAILKGSSALWHLWAMAMAFTFAYAIRCFDALTAIATALVVGSLLHKFGHVLGGSVGRFGEYMPIYCVGIRFPQEILRLARWRSPVGFTALGSCYVMLLSAPDDAFVFNVFRDGIGIIVAIVGASWATDRWPSGTRLLAWLGSKTLPIYILHFPIVAFLGCWIIRHGIGHSDRIATIWLFLPLLSAASIAFSLGLYGLLKRAGGGWLFQPSLDTLPWRRKSGSVVHQ